MEGERLGEATRISSSTAFGSGRLFFGMVNLLKKLVIFPLPAAPDFSGAIIITLYFEANIVLPCKSGSGSRVVYASNSRSLSAVGALKFLCPSLAFVLSPFMDELIIMMRLNPSLSHM